DHSIGTAQELREHATPSGDVESPLTRPSRETRRAADRVGLAAIATVFRYEMVLRADCEVIVQRAIEGNTNRRRQFEDRARQAMDVVEMQARDTDGLQHVGEERQLVGQAEIGSEALALARPIQLYRILVRRLDIKHFGTVAEEPRKVVHVAANASTTRKRNEHEELLCMLLEVNMVAAHLVDSS